VKLRLAKKIRERSHLDYRQATINRSTRRWWRSLGKEQRAERMQTLAYFVNALVDVDEDLDELENATNGG